MNSRVEYTDALGIVCITITGRVSQVDLRSIILEATTVAMPYGCNEFLLDLSESDCQLSVMDAYALAISPETLGILPRHRIAIVVAPDNRPESQTMFELALHNRYFIGVQFFGEKEVAIEWLMDRPKKQL